MNKKELKKFKKVCVGEMPLRKKERKHILSGNHLHQIHFDKIPKTEEGKNNWLKKELVNYLGLRGFLRGKPGLETPMITDDEFEDLKLLFQLPYIY